MDTKEILEKAQRLTEERARILKSRAARHVLGFFVAKRFLVMSGMRPEPTVKLNMEDVFMVADRVEPRIWEVLPAALLRFPGTFTHKEMMPQELKDVLRGIERNEIGRAPFKGVPFEKIKYWANHRGSDGRTRPSCEKRRTKSFRLRPAIIAALRKEATDRGITETEILESLVHTSLMKS